MRLADWPDAEERARMVAHVVAAFGMTDGEALDADIHVEGKPGHFCDDSPTCEGCEASRSLPK